MKTVRPTLDSFALEKLKIKLSEKIGWVIANKPDCAKLSDIIHLQGNGQLSETTLYRIFFQFEKHQPYKHTLDILCKFLGYKDSFDFLENIQQQKEQLHFNGIQTDRGGGRNLLYYCIEHSAKKPMYDFFDNTDESEHAFKVDLSVGLFDALLKGSNQYWFFKHFVHQPYVRHYFFELGHDPKFRINNYDAAYVKYLESIDRSKDISHFQNYVFGSAVLFRHYFLTDQSSKAVAIGKTLYGEVKTLEDVADELYIFPFIRYTAYKLWYLTVTGAESHAIEDYARYLIELCRKSKPDLDFIQRKILFHTVAETFVHSSLDESFHWDLKNLFKEDYSRFPDILYSKHLKYSLPYFEQNGMVHYRP